MGDLLFKFSGRIGRLGYLLALLCMGVAVTVVFMLQRFLGDWKFGSIFVIAAIVVPLIIYLAATSKRFQDRSRHPLLGFLFFYIIPAGLLYAAYMQVFIMPGDGTLMPEGIIAFAQEGEWTPQKLVLFGAPVLAALLFIYGQISLLLRKGTSGENVFDEIEALSVAD